MISRLFDNAAKRRAIAFVSLGIVLWLAAVSVDAFEFIDHLLHSHEGYELDEILIAFIIASLLAFGFTVSRIRELNSEIAERNRLERDVEWNANHDALTRLPNRRGLAEEISQITAKLSATDHYAVFSIDLDGFKKINDLLGHHAGDEALVEVAARLRRIFPDDRIFRLGGDEFAIIHPVVANAEADAYATSIVQSLTKSYTLSKSTAELGASVGIAHFPENAADLAAALRCADMAMYVAKREKSGGISHFKPFMNDLMTARATMEMALRDALRTGAIVPHYQPLVDLKTGELRGFEALARWQGEDGTYIPPSDFIPLAEDTGLIVELSDQLLHKASTEARNWPSDIRLAFNISPAQLGDKLLGLRILGILGKVGLPPQRLEVEITESALVQDITLAEAILSDLHDAGINIALDDFGTGYSSLSQLSKFKFDKIKIDRSFVASFEGDEKQGKIVRAMLGLGHGLGITTTAEGIETTMQYKALQELGCDFGQGYLFGKAMSGTDVETYFSSGKARKAI